MELCTESINLPEGAKRLSCVCLTDQFDWEEIHRSCSINALAANANWTLTDYTLEAGPLAFVRGSLIMFHGATWRGAFPRTAPGTRRG